MPRSSSQSITCGTMRAARSLCGLATIATVLTAGMQQELLVTFGAQDGAVDDGRTKAERFGSGGDARAGGPMKIRIAHDATFSHRSPAPFELRLYPDLPFSPCFPKRRHTRQPQRSGAKDA